nr:MAG TPA_asm: hypothetical protein [Caudoviricetes sp.]
MCSLCPVSSMGPFFTQQERAPPAPGTNPTRNWVHSVDPLSFRL